MMSTARPRSRASRRTVIQALRERIERGRWRPGERLPAEQAIADDLSVSRILVRRSLDTLAESGYVKRIRNVGCFVTDAPPLGPTVQADEENAAKTALIPQTVLVIHDGGRFQPDNGPSGWSKAVDAGIMDRLREDDGACLTLSQTHLRNETPAASLTTSPPRGALVTCQKTIFESTASVLSDLRKTGVPIVLLGNEFEMEGCDRVVFDHRAGTRALTKWLIERGRSRILRVWQAGSSYRWREERDKGYEEALTKAGLPVLPVVEPHITEEEDDPRERFALHTRQVAGFLAEHVTGADPVDAILSLTDRNAYVVGEACRLLGKEPGQDILIAGYDNIWAECPEREYEAFPPAVTIDKGNFDAGRRMLDLLEARIADPDRPAQRLLIAPQLIEIEE